MIPELPLLYQPAHETPYSAWTGHFGFAQRLVAALGILCKTERAYNAVKIAIKQ